ncbi:MAG TPA: class I SAM-dependent methyltransferase, partial [Rhodanobacteraceae bacterium]|nr:class I SAM-dependent methyltransferase [Rhodanobacteraceae bacterium]
MSDPSGHGADPYAGYTEWKGWDGVFRAGDKDARYYAAEFRGLALAGKRVLEIGFGNGSFLAWAKSEGADAAGIELNAQMREAARRNGFVAFEESLAELAARDRRYDLVVAFDVLEHWDATELIDNFRSIRTLLVDGGVFLARFPNGQSPFGRAYQHGDFSHKSTLTTYKIEYLAAMCGFEIVRVANPCRVPSRQGALGALRQWWLAGRRRRIERTIARLYGIRKLPLDPNLVAVL